MGWRPENWKNPNRLEIVMSAQGGDPSAFSAYETGADAMLEALAKASGGYQIRFDRTEANDILIYVYGITKEKDWLEKKE